MLNREILSESTLCSISVCVLSGLTRHGNYVLVNLGDVRSVRDVGIIAAVISRSTRHQSLGSCLKTPGLMAAGVKQDCDVR